MCDSLLRLESYEFIEIKWRAMTLQVKKDPNGMGQDFPDQAMLKMPQLMHSQAGDSKALRQMRAHGFHALAQAGADFEQRRTMGRGHLLRGAVTTKTPCRFANTACRKASINPLSAENSRGRYGFHGFC